MDCLFCGIVQGKVPAKVIYKDDDILAFHDISPKAPIHILIIPTKHIATLDDVEQDDILIVGKILFRAKEIASQLGISERGYRLVLNCHVDGGQSVYHIHCHLLGGRKMAWPPG